MFMLLPVIYRLANIILLIFKFCKNKKFLLILKISYPLFVYKNPQNAILLAINQLLRLKKLSTKKYNKIYHLSTFNPFVQFRFKISVSKSHTMHTLYLHA